MKKIGSAVTACGVLVWGSAVTGPISIVAPFAAAAATITVNTTADNTTADDGKCTLREAIANVNAAADRSGGDCAAGTGAGDTIIFSLRLPATIRLIKQQELFIAQNMIITGPGSGLLAIDGRRRTRVFHIAAGATAMSELTIRNGRVTSQSVARGGGILVDSGAALDLTNCTLSGNQATSSGCNYQGCASGGGAIEVAGTATLTNCTIRGNTASGGGGSSYDYGDGSGGGIEVAGTATLTNCTLSRNNARGYQGLSYGGGIEVTGTATLIHCTLSRNTASRGYAGNDDGSGSGYGDGSGGGIEIEGTATLTDCTISGNTAGGKNGGTGSGGGMWIVGSATLTNCTINGNLASYADEGRYAYGGYAYGGGIECVEGTATLTNCTISGNTARSIYGGSGGGIDIGYDEGYVTATLTNCTISNNTVIGTGAPGISNDGDASGGGIYNGDASTMRLTDCTISGNTASGASYSRNGTDNGGGIDNEGTATLTNCTISDNSAIVTAGGLDGGGVSAGGGIYNASGGDASMSLANCTLSGNTAAGSGRTVGSYGGGVDNESWATFTNCTLSGNTASGYGGVSAGGGIENGGNRGPTYTTATLTNCTLWHNRATHGGGVDNAGVATLTNTIVANSELGGNCSTPLTSGGHNLSSDNTCFASGSSDLLNTPPLLAPLADNGGATATLALCAGPGTPARSCTGPSPAIDTGDDSVTGPPDNLTTDQRGLPRLSGAHADIGAYEVQQ